MGSNHLINESLVVEAQAKHRYPQLAFDGHLVLPQGVVDRIECPLVMPAINLHEEP